MKRSFPVLGALLATVAILLTAADKPTNCPKPACDKSCPTMLQRTYAVADLVIPIPGCPSPVEKGAAIGPAGCCLGMGCCVQAAAVPSAPTVHEALIKLITSTVSPQCWAALGGCCTVEYYPVGMGLVVHAPADVQEQVADLLGALRRLQDVEVAVEMRLVTVSDLEMVKRFGIPVPTPCTSPITFRGAGQEGFILYGQTKPAQLAECVAAHGCPEQACHEGCPHCEKLTVMPRPEKPACVFLTDCQVVQFLEAIQGDRRANIMCAPKITMINGQSSQVQVMENAHYVTGVDFVEVNGQTVPKPINQLFALGHRFELCPHVTADRQSVLVRVHMNQNTLVSEQVPVIPTTYFITPKMADGGPGRPVPFTQFIQQPRLNHLDVEFTESIADGATLAVYCGQQEHETRWETGPPVLSRIPYVNRLFKNVGYGTETQHVLLLVTPRVFVNHEEEAKSCPGKCCEKDCACCDKCCKDKTASHEKECKCSDKDCKCCDKCCKAKINAESSKECKCCGKECKCCDKGCEQKPAAIDAAVPAPCATVIVRVVDSRVVSPQEQRNERMAQKAMEKYHAAVQAGDLEKAREHAMEALDLDPACFHKQMAGSASAQPLAAAPPCAWVPVMKKSDVPPYAIAVQFPDGEVRSVSGSGPIPPPPAAMPGTIRYLPGPIPAVPCPTPTMIFQMHDGTVQTVTGSGPFPPLPAPAGGVRYLTAPMAPTAMPVTVPPQTATPTPAFWDTPTPGMPRYWPEPQMPTRTAPPSPYAPACVPTCPPGTMVPPPPAPTMPCPATPMYYQQFVPAGTVPPPPPVSQILPTPTMGACLQALSPTGGVVGITPTGVDVLPPPVADEPPAKSKGWFWNTKLGRWLGGNGVMLNIYSSDPNVRMQQLLNQSEDLPQIQIEWGRPGILDQPQHVTPERIHGGIK
jgi:hypothetical protein